MMRLDLWAASAVAVMLWPSHAVAAEPPVAPASKPPAVVESDSGEGPARPAATDTSESPEVTVTSPPAPVSLTPVISIERRRRFNLIIAGVSTLLAAYTADRLLARDLSQSGVGWVPLVGPWWILSEESARPNPSPALQALLVVDGLVQLSGLALTITGTFLRYDRVVLRLPSTAPGLPASPIVTP